MADKHPLHLIAQLCCLKLQCFSLCIINTHIGKTFFLDAVFLEFPPNGTVTLMSGSSGNLVCEVKTTNDREVIWLFGDQVVPLLGASQSGTHVNVSTILEDDFTIFHLELMVWFLIPLISIL